MKKISFRWFDKNADLGIFLLRLFASIRILYGVVDNIFYWEDMVKFKMFLEAFNFPFPLISAVVSVYAQFFAGMMLLLGWKIRFGAIILIGNFLVALIMVHRHDSIEQMTPAMALLFISILLLFTGAGRYSLEGKQSKRWK